MKTIIDGTPDYQAGDGRHHDVLVCVWSRPLPRSVGRQCTRVWGLPPIQALPSACRSPVGRSFGDSGQKTQGFLSKLGLTRALHVGERIRRCPPPKPESEGSEGAQRERGDSDGPSCAVQRTNRRWRCSSHRGLWRCGTPGVPTFWVASNPTVAAVPIVKLAHPAAVDRDGTGNDAALIAWAKSRHEAPRCGDARS